MNVCIGTVKFTPWPTKPWNCSSKNFSVGTYCHAWILLHTITPRASKQILFPPGQVKLAPKDYEISCRR
jgi:hypothetical protein